MKSRNIDLTADIHIKQLHQKKKKLKEVLQRQRLP